MQPNLSPLLPLPDAEQKRALKETHASFWVTASAGSGKTMLLTQRFLALLLDGAAPERILCLTYTRAAAAEMSTRIMGALKNCSKEEEVFRLYRAFFDRDPSFDEQQRALTLHTRSLDCKGGLRVMTFHAFCQSILGKFPLESGIPPHFRLVEQGREQQLGKDALFATTTSAQQLATINDFMPLETCVTCINKIAARARSPKELAQGKATIARLFALEAKQPSATESLPREVLLSLETTLEQHRKELKTTDDKKLQKLSAWLKNGGEENYRNLFLTQKGLLPRLSFLTKDTLAILSDGTKQTLRREAERLAALLRDQEQQQLRAINLALYTLAAESAKALEVKRRRHALLDFDDLIDKTQELLTSSRTPWVHYKLDGSFDHVLIDEAQDTNHAQWSIVEQLTEEIFSKPARLPKAEGKARSLFVVGDEKQSIYSFQGADLRRFTAARELFRARALDANMPFVELTLTGSYRSLAPVLKVVDQTFATHEMLASLQAVAPDRPALDEEQALRPLQHKAHRTEQGGGASLHLLTLDNPPPSTAEQKTAWAQSIAAFVTERLLGEKAPPLSDGKSPHAGDVLLLLQQRTQLMQPLLAVFAEKKLPCEDIDKFDLTATLQAEDLLAWLRFLVLPEDELNLASLLKTPFLAMTEEELQALCLARLKQRQNLWHALCGCDEQREVVAWLKHSCAQACLLSPFESLRFLLEHRCPRASSGTAALLAVHRNLDPAENLCEEALSFVQSHTPATLPQFLEHLEGLQVTVKRESITQPTDKMRLMTIHGAKGLEAPIVVLPLFYLRKPRSDTMLDWRFERRDNPTSLYLPGDSLDILKGDENPASLGSRLLRQKEQEKEDLEKEQQRLLYVAMTRARDRLVMLAPKDKDAEIWSAHIKATAQKNKWQTFQKHDTEDEGGETKAENFFLGLPPSTMAPQDSQVASEEGAGRTNLGAAKSKTTLPSVRTPVVAAPVVAAPVVAVPPFLFCSPADETPLRQPRSASRRRRHADEPRKEGARGGHKRLDQRSRGIILHSLVQKLVEKRETAREEQARSLLRQALQPFALAEGERLRLLDDWVGKTLRLLEHPLFFSSESATLFEVALAGNLSLGGFQTDFVGRLDLLQENATTRLFGDLKTDAIVPQTLPQDYASQFGIYRALLEALKPKKLVEGYVLWFETGEVRKLTEGDMPPPDADGSFSP